ncbi:MAG: hypothetical protein H0W72_14785 [Planctomycetes bacterium]|nr:hypothetical protein [Planctomycetota bacterium]
MFELALLLGPGGALLWCLWEWRARRRFLERLTGSSCMFCRASFADATSEYLGGVSRAQRQGLDRFQRRFARYQVVCGDCGAVNICTVDGVAFRAYLPREE